MAGKPGALALLAFIAFASVLEVFSQVVGIPLDHGIGADIAFLPSLFALFVFGFEYALYVSLLTFFVVIALGSPWFEAALRLVSVLPFISIAGYQMLAARGLRFNAVLVNAFFGFYLALLFFIAYMEIGFAWAGGPLVPLLPTYQPTQPVTLSLGELLLGVAPAAFLALSALFILYSWRRFGEGADPSIFANRSALGWLLLLALPVRGAALAATYFYCCGPALTGLRPTQLLSTTHPLALLGWPTAFGLVELLLAWAASLAVKDTANIPTDRAKAKLRKPAYRDAAVYSHKPSRKKSEGKR